MPAVDQFAKERRVVQQGGRSYQVLCSASIVRGRDTGVVLMHEVFGLTESVLRLAGTIAQAGFVVWVPILFGPSHTTTTPLRGAAGVVASCIRREIYAFAANRSSPITDVVRALCRELSNETGRPVGVVGLCLTGNFALATTTEAEVNAVVCGQPSLPMPPCLSRKHALHLGPNELEALRRRAAEGLDIFVARFDRDYICPPERVNRLREVVGEAHFIKPDIPGSGHAVFTESLSLDPNHPTQHALREMIGYLQRRLSPA
jgi:dienelactone hydrolase